MAGYCWSPGHRSHRSLQRSRYGWEGCQDAAPPHERSWHEQRLCRGEMLQLRGVLLEDREEPHAAPSDALELTRTDGLKVILGRQRRLARLRQITSHDFIPVCLQRRQPGVGNFEPSVTGHTRTVRITFRCQQAHPRGRINRARHSNGITLLERFHDIGERARPYEGRPAPDPITRQSRAGEPDPRLIRGCVICLLSFSNEI